MYLAVSRGFLSALGCGILTYLDTDIGGREPRFRFVFQLQILAA